MASRVQITRLAHRIENDRQVWSGAAHAKYFARFPEHQGAGVILMVIV